jgi:hypothetical protein
MRGSVLVLKDGLLRLFFLGHVSSQYVVKNASWVGGRFISVVDHGWVEWRTGHGVKSLLGGGLASSVQSFNSGHIPIFFLVGVVRFFAVISL